MTEGINLTPSPLTNKLIALCTQVETQAVPPKELYDLVQKSQADLIKVWNDFKRKVNECEEDHYTNYELEINDIYQAFGNFQAALDEMEGYFQDNQEEHLRAGAEVLKEATFELIRALQAYQARELAMGPTDIPYVNFLIKSKEAFTDGRLSASLFRNLVAGAKSSVQKAMKELEHESPSPERNQLQAAYKDHQQGIDLLERYINTQEEGLLDEGVEMIVAAAEQIRDALLKYNLKLLTASPTQSPQANLMINVTRALIDARLPEAVFLDALNNFYHNMEIIKNEFKLYAGIPSNSESVMEEIKNAKLGFELHDLAFNDYNGFLETRNVFLLQRALKQIEDGAKVLYAAFKAFQEIAEKEGKTVCFKCQKLNTPENKTCVHCGSPLPKFLEAVGYSTFEITEDNGGNVGQTTGEMIMTENLKKLFDAANKVAEGEMNVQEFAGVLDWMENVVAGEKSRIQTLAAFDLSSIPPDEIETAKQIKSIIDETKKNLLLSFEEFVNGLALMRDFSKDRDKDHLVEGIRSVWQAATKVYQCERTTQQLQQARQKKA